MTAKRDLKKRVRERQARTGESYMVARRHVVAAVDPPETEPAPAPAASAIVVDELIDLTEAAIGLGLRCNVLVFPRLAALVDPVMVLTRVRDALLSTPDDPETEPLRALALRGVVAPPQPRDDYTWFIARVRAGLAGTSRDRRMLALHVAGTASIVPIVCAAWRHDPQLVLMSLEDSVVPTLARLGTRSAAPERAPFLVIEGRPAPMARPLFLVFEDQRFAMRMAPFVIGRQRSSDLQIKDGLVSRAHAAVLHRVGSFYIKDLGSTAGLVYRGMRIDNKRIEEGDVFSIGPYELRFTFRETDT